MFVRSKKFSLDLKEKEKSRSADNSELRVDNRISRELSEIYNQLELPSIDNIRKTGMPILSDMVVPNEEDEKEKADSL